MLHLRPSQVQQEDSLDEGCACRSPEKQMGGELAGVLVLCQDRFSGSRGLERGEVLLALDIEAFDHTYQPAYNKRAPGFKPCVEGFMTACQVCGGRDVVEEFLAAGI